MKRQRSNDNLDQILKKSKGDSFDTNSQDPKDTAEIEYSKDLASENPQDPKDTNEVEVENSGQNVSVPSRDPVSTIQSLAYSYLNAQSEEEANSHRRNMRITRDEMIAKLSKLEDKYDDDDHPRVENMRNQLMEADSYMRAAGLDEVIDDSDSPESLDSCLDSSDSGSDMGGDV